MIPLRDDIPSQRYPVVTVTIIVLNILAFFFEMSAGPNLEQLLMAWGIVPVLYTEPELGRLVSLPQKIFPFIASIFLHGGWMHLIGNMWSLWIFGDNVEDRLGRGRFILLYLLGGSAASFLHIWTNSHSAIPTIGASGAIAAVMGAYFRLYPHATVTTIIPPFFLGPLFHVPAILFLGWWFILQFFNGSLSLLASNHVGGIAWWGHIGGFISGILLGGALKGPALDRRESEQSPDYWRPTYR